MARQKAQIEKEVLQPARGTWSCATSGAYGWQWEPKNFVLQIRAKLGAGPAGQRGRGRAL